MSEKCFCHFNGFAVKDATARKQIVELGSIIANSEVVVEYDEDTESATILLVKNNESTGNLYPIIDSQARTEIETLKALVDKLDKQLNPPVKVWRIRGDADISSVGITENIRFYANDIEFDTIQIGDPYSLGDPHLWYDYQNMRHTYLWGMSESHPNSDAYSTIKIPYNTKLSAEFTSWLEANAEYLGEEEYVRPEPAEMITFYVGDYMFDTTHTLTCLEGMTWGEFVHGGNHGDLGFSLGYNCLLIYSNGVTYQVNDIAYETVIVDGATYSGGEL